MEAVRFLHGLRIFLLDRGLGIGDESWSGNLRAWICLDFSTGFLKFFFFSFFFFSFFSFFLFLFFSISAHIRYHSYLPFQSLRDGDCTLGAGWDAAGSIPPLAGRGSLGGPDFPLALPTLDIAGFFGDGAM